MRRPRAAVLRFACPLPAPAGDRADSAVGADGADGADRAPAVVARGFWFQAGPTIPPELLRRARHRDRFQPGQPLAWVEDEATGAVWPYWVPREWAPLLARLVPGEPMPDSVPARVRAALRQVGIVGPGPGRFDPAAAGAVFARQQYACLTGLVPAPWRDALADYYRTLLAAPGLVLGDEQCARRYGLHNEPLSRFVHDQLTRAVARTVGTDVKPSYTYTVGYREGAVLDRHTDRDQCAYTAGLLVDCTGPDPVPEPWPLLLSTPGGEASVVQDRGDVLVFAGQRLPHRRGPLPAGHTSTSLLLHYVPADFTGPLR